MTIPDPEAFINFDHLIEILADRPADVGDDKLMLYAITRQAAKILMESRDFYYDIVDDPDVSGGALMEVCVCSVALGMALGRIINPDIPGCKASVEWLELFSLPIIKNAISGENVRMRVSGKDAIYQHNERLGISPVKKAPS